MLEIETSAVVKKRESTRTRYVHEPIPAARAFHLQPEVVKPENLLLYSDPEATKNHQAPFIKLADFGWAVIVDRPSPPPAIPSEGVGSLWYAPPELNPPVRGAEIVSDELQAGKSDMWSTGIITYLLLTGHSPFNKALVLKDPVQREAEVIRLAAFGDINMSTKAWNMDLSPVARDFILALVRPDPAKRLSPSAGLHHAFIAAAALCADLCGSFRLCPHPSMLEDVAMRLMPVACQVAT
ncbi:cmkA [Symbiodinium natans]|uniref:CmkA protein n=1 Tax=Symbiodinium natans TaxID=878477 RepID=A0A812S784_9DINO|nr:cmkA [Symbiodinium natans]